MTTSAPGEAPLDTTPQNAPALTPAQLSEVLTLLPGSDSVELKVTIPEADQRSVVERLGMDVMKAQIRQVAFFDTPDLRLSSHGLVVRARRIQARSGDSVVKLRPVVPAQLTPDVRRTPGFGVEVDALPGGFVCSGRMKARADDRLLHQVFRGAKPLRRVFTRAQRALFDDHAPEGVALDDLTMIGPVNILKLRFTPKGYPRGLVAELWFYPDGSHILELSTKCLPSEAFAAAAETKAYLAGRGVDLSAPQQTKTRTAFSYFASADDAP
jgi:hypothetical protein